MAFERQATASKIKTPGTKWGLSGALASQTPKPQFQNRLGVVCYTCFLRPKTPVTLSHPPDPFVGATLPQMFVLFRPAPQSHEYSGCISVSNGDEGVACLKAHQAAASKPPAFCPENVLTTLFCPGWDLFAARNPAETKCRVGKKFGGRWLRQIGRQGTHNRGYGLQTLAFAKMIICIKK